MNQQDQNWTNQIMLTYFCFSYLISWHHMIGTNSIPHLHEQHHSPVGRDPIGEVRGWSVVQTVLRLRWWKHLDADVYGAFLRLRKRNLLLQVSTMTSHFSLSPSLVEAVFAFSVPFPFQLGVVGDVSITVSSLDVLVFREEADNRRISQMPNTTWLDGWLCVSKWTVGNDGGAIFGSSVFFLRPKMWSGRTFGVGFWCPIWNRLLGWFS